MTSRAADTRPHYGGERERHTITDGESTSTDAEESTDRLLVRFHYSLFFSSPVSAKAGLLRDGRMHTVSALPGAAVVAELGL